MACGFWLMGERQTSNVISSYFILHTSYYLLLLALFASDGCSTTHSNEHSNEHSNPQHLQGMLSRGRFPMERIISGRKVPTNAFEGVRFQRRFSPKGVFARHLERTCLCDKAAGSGGTVGHWCYLFLLFYLFGLVEWLNNGCFGRMVELLNVAICSVSRINAWYLVLCFVFCCVEVDKGSTIRDSRSSYSRPATSTFYQWYVTICRQFVAVDSLCLYS